MNRRDLLIVLCLWGIISLWGMEATAQSVRLGVTEESKIDFSVSPNPATERISISSLSVQDVPLQIRFFSVTGNLIKHIELENYEKDKDISIEVSDLTRGLYFVELRTGPHSLIKKVVLR
jgi:hypothetical protein